MIATKQHIILVKDYIENNLSESLAISKLAKKSGLSSSTLRKRFQLLYKISVHQFILQQRMTRAKELLLECKYTIAEVGRMVGYNEPSNFSQAFLKYYGTSPSNIVSSLDQ